VVRRVGGECGDSFDEGLVEGVAEQDAVVEEGAQGGCRVGEGGSATLFVGDDVFEP
jgi:hypothetical protein